MDANEREIRNKVVDEAVALMEQNAKDYEEAGAKIRANAYADAARQLRHLKDKS